MNFNLIFMLKILKGNSKYKMKLQMLEIKASTFYSIKITIQKINRKTKFTNSILILL